MSDYMKEAERLIEEYGNAEWKVGRMSEHSDDAEEIVTRENARAALLAHIQQYGDTRAAAGYARCLREMLDCRTCRNYTRDGCIQTAQCVDGDGYRRATPVRFWSAALRGEVKP